MSKTSFFFLVLLFPFFLNAQDENLRNCDFVYLDNISSSLLYRADSVLGYPMVDLTSRQRLHLSFDDMDGDEKDYLYTIVHCDANWNPSDLDELDYIDGYIENSILDYEYSYNTRVEYTHYFLTLPNEDISWTKSGNYLLKVYEDEEEKRLALTKRFVVTENRMKVLGKFMRPSSPAISSTHQKLSFTISHPNVRVNNPENEVKVVVLQNGRWDNALTGLKPRTARNEQLFYDYLDKVVFPGGKEFRQLDMRTFEFKTGRIKLIDEYSNHYDVFLHPDKARNFRPYTSIRDLNGKYGIENLTLSLNQNRARRANDEVGLPSPRITLQQAHQSDYAFVHFALDAPIPYEGRKVYLVGGFSEWQFLPQYELTYNESNNGYEAKIPLKQGFYNYVYATVDEQDPQKIDFTETEGDWHETENDYTVLVYFRPFGQRYDQVIAIRHFNSITTQ